VTALPWPDRGVRTDRPGPADQPGLAAPPGPAGQPGQATRPRTVGPSGQAGRTTRPRPSGQAGRTGQPGPPGLTVRPGFSARRPAPPRHLADLDPAGRRAAAAELGQPQFRADQLSRHYFGRLTEDPAQMTDLPAAGRAELAKALLPGLLTAQREQQADQGRTVKTLWRAADGAYLESVLMRYPGRVTMCVS